MGVVKRRNVKNEVRRRKFIEEKWMDNWEMGVVKRRNVKNEAGEMKKRASEGESLHNFYKDKYLTKKYIDYSYNLDGVCYCDM